MVRIRLALVCVLGILVVCNISSRDARGVDSIEFPAPSSIEDAPVRLIPKDGRSQAEQDRIDAAGMYAHGRMLFRRQKYAEAVRRYQRAWRYDPQSDRVLDEIIQLALGLKRNGEFMRYLVIKGERNPKDELTLRRLGDYLVDQQDFDRALGMFERSLTFNNNDTEKKDGAVILVRLQMGRLYFLQGKIDKSVEQFAIVLQALDDPKKFGLNDKMKDTILGKPDKTYRLFGEVFLQAGELDDAEKMFQKSNAAKKDESMLAYLLARVAAKRDQHDEALKFLDDYFDSGSDEAKVEPYKLLSELLAETIDDEAKAKAELLKRLKALDQKKPNPSLGIYLAQQALEANDLDLAGKLFRDMTDAKATIETLGGLIEVSRRRGDVAKLLDVLGETILQSGTFEVFGDTMTKITDDEKLVSQLIAAADGQVQTDGNTLKKGVALATAQLAGTTKNYDVVEKYYEIAVKEDKPGKRQVMMTWGLGMFMADENERAAKVFQRGIDEKILEKGSPDLHFYLAGALEMSGETDKALEAARQAISIAPKQARMYGRLPWILYHAKRYKDAELEYAKLLDKFDKDHDSPGSRDALRSARLALSNLCVVQERLPEAEEWLEQVLDEFPEDIGAMNDLGYLWADQNKRLDRALAMVQKAVADEPDNEAYRDSLGWALYRLDRFDEAVKELETAASGEDPDGVILDHLADAYFKSDQKDKALETWKRAAAAFKKSEEHKFLKKTEDKIKKHSAE